MGQQAGVSSGGVTIACVDISDSGCSRCRALCKVVLSVHVVSGRAFAAYALCGWVSRRGSSLVVKEQQYVRCSQPSTWHTSVHGCAICAVQQLVGELRKDGPTVKARLTGDSTSCLFDVVTCNHLHRMGFTTQIHTVPVLPSPYYYMHSISCAS